MSIDGAVPLRPKKPGPVARELIQIAQKAHHQADCVICRPNHSHEGKADE